MKFKRYKYLPVLFLVSFLISFSTNVAFSANCTICVETSHTKSSKHLNEKVVNSELNELLFEENENEDEVEFDFIFNLIPFFLDFTTLLCSSNSQPIEQEIVLDNPVPIYINTCNFRI